jgi:hypothetical protein
VSLTFVRPACSTVTRPSGPSLLPPTPTVLTNIRQFFEVSAHRAQHFVKGEALTPDSNPGPLAHQRRALPLGYSHQRREKVWRQTPSARAQGYKWDGTEES